MARNVTAQMRKRGSRSAKKNAGRDDLSILAPDRTITIGGRAVTVREYRFLEGMNLHAIAEPIVAQLAALAEQGDALPPEQLDAAIAQHPEAVARMIAIACDQPMDWVINLPVSQSDQLFATWWAVNNGFFVRRVQQRVLLRRAQALAGRASSSPSPVAISSKPGGSSSTTPAGN